MANTNKAKSQFRIAPSRKARLRKFEATAYRMLYPKLLEKKYEMQLAKLMRSFEELIRTVVVSTLPRLEKEFLATTRNDSSDQIRLDDYHDSANEMVKSLLSGFRGKLTAFTKVISGVAMDVDEHSAKQLSRVMKEGLGVDILSGDKKLNASLDIWVRDNVKQIASLASDETKRMEQIILDGFRNGLRHEEVSKGILDTLKASADRATSQVKGMSLEDRARMIARDQIGKLNASVTRERQAKLGLKRYVWRTALDERVRPTHRALEGQTFAWNASDGDLPPEGHPGVPINCRCHAEPKLSDFFGDD